MNQETAKDNSNKQPESLLVETKGSETWFGMKLVKLLALYRVCR